MKPLYIKKNGVVNKISGVVTGTEVHHIYGFIEHMATLDPVQRIEYIETNENYTPMTVNLSGDHTANYGSWSNFYLLKENKPYMVKANGEVDYVLDPNDYTKKIDGITASDVANTSYTGGAFAWLPKIYTYQYIDGNDRYVYFSKHKENNNYEAIGFIDGSGNELEGIWLPMFYGTEITQSSKVKIMTLATGYPTKNRDTNTQKSYIDNFSSQARFFGGPIINILADLLIMLGKNSDIQAVFGVGNSSGGGESGIKNNTVVSGGQFYGTSDGQSLNKALHSLILLTQNSYLRDPYILLINGALKVSPNYEYDLTGNTYQSTNITYPSSSASWSDYPHKCLLASHFGAFPDYGPYSGSSTTGLTDYFHKSVSGTMVTLRIGDNVAGKAGGLRCFRQSSTANDMSWGYSASALLLPPVGHSPA